MPIPFTPNYHGRRLLRELTRLRRQADLTQTQAALLLQMTAAKIHRIETHQLPGYHELTAMLDLYDVSDHAWDTYTELWEQARKRGWWRQYNLKDSSYVRMEHEAAASHEFQLGRIPELLQTEQYARAGFDQSSTLRSNKTINNSVAICLRRQQRLFGHRPLILRSLIHEPTLYQGVDQEQLEQLLDRAHLPNVTLNIVPSTVGLHDGLEGSVTLLHFDDREEPDIAFTNGPLGMVHTQDRDKTLAMRRRLDRLTTLALSPEETISWLKDLANKDHR
jgi:hypothetical protein